MTKTEFLFKLYDGGYKNTLPYPDLKECGGDMLKRDQARAAYRKRESELTAQFKSEALQALELDTHPKADKLFELAWDAEHVVDCYGRSRAFSYSEVWGHMERYAELLK